MHSCISILLLAMCSYLSSARKYLVNSRRNKFGDFSLGKGFDDVVQDVLDSHVFLEDEVTYDVIPELKSSMTCGVMQKASDAKSVLGLSGEISLEYGLISGKGFLSFDEEEEKMTRKVYFKCKIDRTTFTASVNPPVRSNSDVCKFSEIPHAVLAKSISPEETQTAESGAACKLLCCVNEWCKSADFNGAAKECLMYTTNGVVEGLEKNADFIHFDRIHKNNGLNPDAASITTSEVFRKLYGLHYVNSITFGRRYEVEVQVEFSHESDYEKIAGEIEGKARFGLLEVSAKFSVESENSNSETSLKIDISSNTYGFLEKKGLRFPTGKDGEDAGETLIKDIQDNIDAMVSADDKKFQGGSHLTKSEVLQMQNGAYPISYTTSSTKPYFPHAFGQERFDEEDMEEFLRNLDKAYDLKLVLRELLEDVNVRSTKLYERFGLLTGKSKLSRTFLDTKRKMTERIQDLLHLLRLYLDQVPEAIKDFDIYAWADLESHAELDYLTIDQLTSDIEGLLGLTDLDMNDESTAAECVFHGIYADIDGKQVKFAGTVHFSELEVRHVIFDAEGQVVSLGYIPRNEKGEVELVYVRDDCSMIRKGSQFWYQGARYEVESIGNEDYMIGSRVEKPKLKNVRVYIRPKDIKVDNLMLLTRDDLQDVKLIGYEHSAEFSLDDDSRLLYKDGYVCDTGFGINEARTVCTSLGYSRVDSFETNYQIPSANAFGKPHITMDKLECPPNTAWGDNASRNKCTWKPKPSPRCSTDNGIRLICEAKKDYQSQCKVALWGSSNMLFDTKECMSDRFGTFLIDDHCNGGGEHLAVSSASVSGQNCCVVLKDNTKKSLCALRDGEELQGKDFTRRCGEKDATEYHAISVPDQNALVLSVSVSGLRKGESVILKNRITGDNFQLTDSKNKDNFKTAGKCGLFYDVIITDKPPQSTCVLSSRERSSTNPGSFMLDHVQLQVKCSSTDSPTASPIAAPRRCTNPSTKHGGKDDRVRYEKSVVTAPKKCKKQTQTRKCNNGVWGKYSGKYKYSSCSVRCKNPTKNHGETQSRVRYEKAVVTAPETCNEQTQKRTCSNGVWGDYSGSYSESSCSVRCANPTTDNGGEQARERFEKSAVTYPSKCKKEVQTRTCNNGVWGDYSGSYSKTSCKVRCRNPTTNDGESLSVTRYRKSEVYSPDKCSKQTRTKKCTNGKWSSLSGSGSYTKESCKVIDVNKLAANQKKCADENGTCRCNGHVRYGKRKFTNWYNMGLDGRTSIPCNNDIFGDPEKGETKKCYCSNE